MFEKPAISCCDTAEWSSSTEASGKFWVPPEKIEPNRTMKITGNASVQKSAARLR